MSGRRSAAGVVAVGVLVAGCGVSPQAEPVPLTTPAPGPPRPLATTGPLGTDERLAPPVPPATRPSDR